MKKNILLLVLLAGSAACVEYVLRINGDLRTQLSEAKKSRKDQPAGPFVPPGRLKIENNIVRDNIVLNKHSGTGIVLGGTTEIYRSRELKLPKDCSWLSVTISMFGTNWLTQEVRPNTLSFTLYHPEDLLMVCALADPDQPKKPTTQ